MKAGFLAFSVVVISAAACTPVFAQLMQKPDSLRDATPRRVRVFPSFSHGFLRFCVEGARANVWRDVLRTSQQRRPWTMFDPTRTRAPKRVPLAITVSVEDYQFAESVLASPDPRQRDDFFMAAIDALRRQVEATRTFLVAQGLYGQDNLPNLQYDIVVRLASH
jgi:hypothetical protein